MTYNRILSVIALLLLNTNAFSQNWAHWRGPNQNGIVDAVKLPTEWSETQNIAWRIELPGPGPSTPIILGDNIYLTAAEKDELILMCISKSGKELWKKTLSQGDRQYFRGESNNAAPSPTTDGKNIWVFFGTGDFVCVDMDGNEIWRTNIQERYGKFTHYHGMVVSPLLDGDVVYFSLMHDNQQAVVALDKNSGKEIWKAARPTDARNESLHSYTSPVIYRFGGIQFLLAHGADYLTAHSLKDGHELWRYGVQNQDSYNGMWRLVANPFPTEDFILVPTAQNGAVIGIDPRGASGNITGDKKYVLWRRSRNTTDVPSPLVFNDLAYLCRENGSLLCLDIKTGEEVYYVKPSKQRHRASPLIADDKLYMLSMQGVMNVIKIGRQYELLATNQIKEEWTSASPIISDGVIYQRSFKALYAIKNEQTETTKNSE